MNEPHPAPRSAKMVDHLRLVGLGGSNKVMQGELSRLARRAFTGERSRELLTEPPRKRGPGGLVYPFAPDLAALAVNYHRTSARVLWDLCESTATRLEPLYEDVFSLLESDRREWLPEMATISVHAFGCGAVGAGERQVVGTIKNAVIDAARQRGSRLTVDPERPDLVIHARTGPNENGETCLTVSLDLAGRPMHERGYRFVSGEAPLREDLAANLVMLARYDARHELLIDPLAGSGTLLIEGGLMAAGKPLWMSGRSPIAGRLPALKAAMASPPKALFGDTRPTLLAAEIDDATFGALDRAVETAGLMPNAKLFRGDFREWNLAAELSPGQQGLILSNPPYGGRLGGSERELAHLYRDLGAWCHNLKGLRAGFIIGEPDNTNGPFVAQLFQKNFGGEPRVKKPISNGPLRAQFLLYDL